MNLLLDTHAFVWWVELDQRLSKAARTAIADSSRVHVSVATAWEIAIKVRLGKIEVDSDRLVPAIAGSGFQELPVSAAHAMGVARLPLLHTDPFDRLLIAQAFLEPLKLLTVDAALCPYGELIMLA